MKKTARILGIVAATLVVMAGAITATNAQMYVYPIGSSYGYGTSYSTGYSSTYPYTSPYSTSGCVVLTKYLMPGSTDIFTGGQVTVLQQFLNRTGSLRGTSGIFDQNTYTAVVNFQIAHGILPTGTVGPITRAAIQQASCNGLVPTPYVPPVNPIYPYNPSYPSNCVWNNNYYSNSGYYYNNNCGLHIDSASASYSYNSMTLTITGYGFSPTNTVYFNGNAYTGYSSSNGQQIVVTIPSTFYTGNYNLYVVNTYGMTSNTLTFPVGNSNNYGYGPVTLSSITGPTNVQSGSSNTWNVTVTNNNYNGYSYNYNYNYNNSNNQYAQVTVNWGDNTSVSSQNLYISGSQNLSFNHTYYGNGTYTMQITVNANGQTAYQNLTVSVNNNGSFGQTYISSISPQSGRVGTNVTIFGSGFTSYNTVHFDNGGSLNMPSFNGTSINYTIPNHTSGCDLTQGSGSFCAQWIQNVTPGTHQIYVTNGNGQNTGTVNFYVTN